ncbi:MAG: metallophosphoesterase [Verrucomicrobiota bacterium]
MDKDKDQGTTWTERLGKRATFRVKLETYRRGSLRYKIYRTIAKSAFHRLIRICVKLVGLDAKGKENMRSIEVEENRVVIDQLGQELDGLRILQVTDLHLEIEDGIEKRIASLLRSLSWDLAVVTGDFRLLNDGPIEPSMNAFKVIAEVLIERGQIEGIPPLVVLGNHDDGAMVPCLEEMGMRVLLNECVSLQLGGEQLWIAGIDDSADFQSYDLGKALRDVPESEPIVLLSHAPDCVREAAAFPVDLMLCGHTHGGQICLPNGFAPLTQSTAPRSCAKGSWSYNGIQGYTSRGASAGGVPYRFNCPPELTIHTLVRH